MEPEPAENPTPITWTPALVRALLDAAPDATLVSDADGTILLVNRQLERMFGLPRAELIGRRVEQFVPVERRSAHVELRRRYLADPSPRPMGQGSSLTARRPDGSEFPVEISLSPVETSAGVLVAAAIRDASDRARTERNLRAHGDRLERDVASRTAELEARTEELALRARHHHALAELGKRIIAARSLADVFDDAVAVLAEELEVELTKILEIVPGADVLLLRAGVGWRDGIVGHATVGADRESQAGYTLLSDGPVIVEDLRKETRFRGPPALLEHGAVSGMSVIIYGRHEPYGVLGAHSRRARTFVVDDVAFLQSVANLLGEAIERHRAEDDLAEARRLARQKERLADIGVIVANVVHDFGNTLAGLSLHAQIIARYAREGRPGEAISEPARILLDQTTHLERLVREFREFARAERLDLGPVDLRQLLESVAGGWRRFAEERKVAIDLATADDLPPVLADEGKLRRVFDNLIKNAVESVEGGPGAVRIGVDARGSDRVRVSVEDSGAGVPPAVDVFKMFATTKEHGSGLGLPICKQIVDAHGGAIEHAPARSRGTVFRIDLPIDGPYGAPRPTPDAG